MAGKKEKKENDHPSLWQLFKRNLKTLHHRVWGKGWKRLIIAVIITLVIIFGALFLTLQVTSQPRFCNTCHVMKPYYSSWKESSHKDVTCTDCHFPPGIENAIEGKFTALSMLVNYFTGVYKKSKPWAEIPDESCMRSGCHQARLLSGKVAFKKNIAFDHAPHLEEMRRGKKLRCTSCHSQIVQGSHISVTESTCFLCHFKDKDISGSMGNVEACNTCHELPTGDAANGQLPVYDHSEVLQKKITCNRCHGNMVVGDGFVPKTRCDTCHAEIEKIKHYGDSALMHKNHITDHKIECQQCHTEIQHKSVSRTEEVKPGCSSCHPEHHDTHLALFSGTGGKGLPSQPDPMYEAGLNCRACHTDLKHVGGFEKAGSTFHAGAGACVTCHEPGYKRILKNWKEQADTKLGQLEKALTEADKRLSLKQKHAQWQGARELLQDAWYNYKLVKYGKAVHNVSYSNLLMEKSYEMARESLKRVGLPAKLPYFDTSHLLIPGECSDCHAGFERKPLEVFGWGFLHRTHLTKQNLPCGRCHSNEKKHGRLIIAKQDCMNCHHKDAGKAEGAGCKNCHDTQDALYYSRLAFSTFKIPNIMAGDVDCTGCHQDKKGQLYRPDKTMCSNCHEKEYEDMFDEWQKSAAGLLEKLRQKVDTDKLGHGDRAYEVLLLLEKDGSMGIHNPELYEKLVEEVLK